MGLLTTNKVNQFGVKEEYWRVLNIKMDLQYKYCDISLGAYASEEARRIGSEPMNIKKVRAKWDENEFLKYFAPSTFSGAPASTVDQNNDGVINMADDIYTRVYQYIKDKDPYFTDAVDI